MCMLLIVCGVCMLLIVCGVCMLLIVCGVCMLLIVCGVCMYLIVYVTMQCVPSEGEGWLIGWSDIIIVLALLTVNSGY